MGRNIVEVANKMKEFMIDDYWKEKIDNLINNLGYTAPEIMYMRWNELHGLMTNSLPSDPLKYSELDIKLISTFSTNTEDEIKASIYNL